MKIIIGVTASISAYKSYELVRILQKKEHHVSVVLTENAMRFVSPISYMCNVITPDCMWSEPYLHNKLLDNLDIFCIAPATANFIAKVANGIADDMLSTLCLISRVKTHIFPAMNEKMLTSSACQNNINKINSWEIFKVHNTEFGHHACGTIGYGRLLPINEISEIITKNHQ